MLLNRVNRRALLLSFPGAAMVIARQSAKRRPPLPRVGEFVRYVDPVTENTLVRLTSLTSSNRLPAPQNAFISTRERYLVFSSDRSGTFCPHLVDLRTGAIRQLAQTVSLDPQSLVLDRTQRAILFIDGGKLMQAQVAGRRADTIMEGITAFAGRSEAELVVVRDAKLQTHAGETLASQISGPCLMSPDGATCLVGRVAADCALWTVPIRPRGEPKLLVSGPVRFPFWSPDSRSVLFLRDVPGNGVMLSEIHRAALDGSPEETVARTSQFASFAPNGDASVFVGASRSKAQPTVDLLLRSAKREMTLCEHRASKPQAVTPVFAPDSRRIYFESDREGKSAVYSINVELLVEPTDF